MLFPVTPGNVGITRGAIALALQRAGRLLHPRPRRRASPSTPSRPPSASSSGSPASSGSRPTARPRSAVVLLSTAVSWTRDRRRFQRHSARPPDLSSTSGYVVRESGARSWSCARSRCSSPSTRARDVLGLQRPPQTGLSRRHRARADDRRPAAARARRRGRAPRAERRAAHERSRRVRRDGARDPLQHATRRGPHGRRC